MARIVVTARLPEPAAVERLRAAGHDVLYREDPVPAGPAELRDLASGRIGVLCMPVDPIDGAFLDACPDIRFVANFGVGVDNIDLDAARRRGVEVTNTPEVLTDAVADHAVALALAAGRRVLEGDRMVRGGSWAGFSTDLLLGLDMSGATVGIVGCGRIGAAVARRLVHGFGMRCLYHQRHPRPDVESDLAARLVSLDELMRSSDLVSVQVPLTDETRGLIGEPELALMKEGAVLVNIGRGPVVDEAALVEAGRGGRIRAGLDVFAEEPLPAGHPLTELDNVVLTPHIASAGQRSRAAMANLAVDNLLAMVAGDAPPTPVA